MGSYQVQQRITRLVDVMTFDDGSVLTMTSLLNNMKHYYPELYIYVYGEGRTPYTSLTIFMKKTRLKSGISLHSGNEYVEIWQYIRDNEDLHAWWML